MGVQSLDDRMLSMLGRVHTAAQAREAIALARSVGFGNVGIDLIHGLPGQSVPGWQDTLRQAVALAPEHISAYGLSIEEGTPFHAMLRKGEIDLPDEESAVRMLEMTGELLTAAGYEHYEIANFARPGFRSRHNQCYWKRGNYLGFGAAAHSFLRRPGYGRRWENPADLHAYCSSAKSGEMPAVGEQILTKEDARAESLFLGLRMLDGVSPADIGAEFGESLSEAFPGVLERLVADGLVEHEGPRLRLTCRGLLLANRVFAAFV
jgi:oxygen-independent coproporphyrinogen-3 oxidase